MFKKKKNNKGFTLVELLVVIAIIGILAVVAVPSLFSSIQKSKVAKLEADISAIKSASTAYYADQSKYPTGEIGNATTPTGIEKDIDDLSHEFGAKYTLSGDAKTGGDLTLTITTTDKINDNGQSKLKSDLANNKKLEVKENEISLILIESK